MTVTAAPPDSPGIESAASAPPADLVAAEPSSTRPLPMTLAVGILAVIAVVTAL